MKPEINVDLAIRYITKKLNEAEKGQFEAWLKESNVNSSQFNEFKKYWELSGKAFENYSSDAAAGWDIVSKRTIKRRNSDNQLHRILKVAASVLVIISLSVAGKVIFKATLKEEMRTFVSGNSVVTVTLPDNSTVWLNDHSELKVPEKFKGSKRNVYLTGEAFFDVTRNPKKPFKIFAQGTITRVLGTSFNLQAEASKNDVRLTVVTGKVSFTKDGLNINPLILLPGQEGICNISSGRLTRKLNTDNNFMAWKTGKIQFKNASINEICDVIGEVYHIKIIPGSYRNSTKYSFTGNFDNATLHEILSVVEQTLQIQFIRDGDAFRIQ